MSDRIFAIDVTACPVKPTGVGRYTYQLTQALLPLLQTPHERLVVFGRSDQREKPELVGAEFVDCGSMSVPKRILWEQVKFPMLLKKYSITVLHSPNYTIPAAASCKRVTTFHDLTCFLFPQRRPFWHSVLYRNVMRYSVRHADRIIAVSENTRQDIKRVLKVSGDNITVVHEGGGPQYQVESIENVQRVTSSLGITAPYFLFIGTVEPTKNIERLIQAFILFKKTSGKPAQLVLAGKLGWGYERVFELMQQAGPDSVKQIGYQDDQTLAALYSGCLAFVYPSLYEGFGIPPLEAMSCGAPVLCSNTSSLPEVVGDAALTFDPHDEKNIAQTMQTVASDEKIRAHLKTAGFARIKVMNWDNTAQKTLDVYRSLDR